MNPEELDTVSRTLYGEIRNGTPLEMAAVAWVIRNRAEHPRWWGRGIVGVCVKQSRGVYQFSCWNRDDPNRQKLISVPTSDPTLARCAGVVETVWSGAVPDMTARADHYCTIKSRPWWSVGITPVYEDSKHRFWRLELKAP